tara:strand:+ start:744 stop:1970 length:1227 start_codon:yes stop_codon:yes gene_type:complete
MKILYNKSTLIIGFAFLSFLLLLPPITYVASLLSSIVLMPLALSSIIRNINVSSINSIQLSQLLLSVCFIYFFLCGFLVTNYYIAIKELIVISYGLCLFSLLLVNPKYRINIQSIVLIMSLILVFLCIHVLNSIDYSNYIIAEGDQVESKNPLGLRISFLSIFLLAIIAHEKSIKKNIKLLIFFTSILGFIAILFLESSRSFLFCLIVIFIWISFNNFKAFIISFLLLFLPTSIYIILYGDQVLRYFSNIPAFNLLFFKLEPYFPGINKYGILQGGAYSRSDFTSQAYDVYLKGIGENPIFGLGPDNSRVLYEKEMGVLTNSHNNFFEIALSYGFIGVTLWYTFFLSIIYSLFKFKHSKYFGISLGVLTGIFAISFISPIYREPDIYVMIGFILLILSRTTPNFLKNK